MNEVADKSKPTWAMLGAVVAPDKSRWTGIGLLVATGAAVSLVGPVLISRILDRALAGASSSELVVLAGGVIAIAILAQSLVILSNQIASQTAWRTTNDIRLRLTRHVLHLDNEFHRSHSAGELIQRVDGDVTAVSDFLHKVLPRVLSTGVLVIGALVVLTLTDWRIGLALFVYVCLLVVVVVRTRRRSVDESASEMSKTAALYGGIEERLHASEDLRANGGLDYAMHRFVEDSHGVFVSRLRRERALMGMWTLVQGSLVAGRISALVLSAVLVQDGSLSLASALLLFQYLQLVGQPIEDLIDQLDLVQNATGALARVSELGSMRSAVQDEGITCPDAGPLSVQFCGVSFDYGDDQGVLHELDLSIAAGRSVGVVGRTGSGKTTCSRLVLRSVEAVAGTVSLGAVPIQNIPVGELRRRVALIPQEVELFGGTIRDNVTLFDPMPTDQAVCDSLLGVGLDSLVAGGIHRRLGPAGTGLSAGEGQLLALARVWLRQPDLIVFDEATARVDPETETRIEAALVKLRQGRTTLTIAHRLSTLEAVQDIVVFDQGRIVESGSRETLARKKDSHFAGLLRLSHGQAN